MSFCRDSKCIPSGDGSGSIDEIKFVRSIRFIKFIRFVDPAGASFYGTAFRSAARAAVNKVPRRGHKPYELYNLYELYKLRAKPFIKEEVMKTGVKVFIFLLCCVSGIEVAAQRVKSVIPYRMVGGKMIVEMHLNGTLRSFIFDTGGRTALTGEVCEELGLVVTDSIVVTDVTGKRGGYPLVTIESFGTLDEKINFKGVSAIKLPAPSPFECFHVDGLIGSELLARVNMMIEIDGRAKTVTITSAERPSTVSLRKMVPFARAGEMPILALPVGAGNQVIALFDTGCPDFLSLKDTDYASMKGKGAYSDLGEGYGEGSIGVGGMSEESVSHRVVFPLVSVGAAKFKNVTTTTSTPPFTLLGVELLDHGKVTIDYHRGRFYFEAYEVENDLISKPYNVNLRVKDGDLVVSTVWDAMKGVVEVGDKVIRINGKPTGKYDFCESVLNGIPELKAKKKNKLTIQTKQGEKVVVY